MEAFAKCCSIAMSYESPTSSKCHHDNTVVLENVADEISSGTINKTAQLNCHKTCTRPKLVLIVVVIVITVVLTLGFEYVIRHQINQEGKVHSIFLLCINVFVAKLSSLLEMKFKIKMDDLKKNILW